jgi:hypothetical protein
MSNNPDRRGMAHHVAQHKGEPYYNEIKQWLHDTKMAQGGGVGDSKLQRKVDEVNRLIKLVNDNDLKVVNSSSTWETPMKYQPIVVSRGGLKITYKELDLYKYNRTGKQSWEEKKETVLKRDMEFDNPLNDIAKWHRKALRENDIMFEDGGEIKTPIIRTQFEEEEYEYGNGGNASEPHRLQQMGKGGGVGRQKFGYEIFVENQITGEKSVVAQVNSLGDLFIMLRALKDNRIDASDTTRNYGYKTLNK